MVTAEGGWAVPVGGGAVLPGVTGAELSVSAIIGDCRVPQFTKVFVRRGQ